MIHWCVIVIVLLNAIFSLALCPYAGYGDDEAILVADSNCKSNGVCTIDNKCNIIATMSSKGVSFSNITAIGNMTNYNHSSLDFSPSKVLVKDMLLSDTVEIISFTNITKMDFKNLRVSSWPQVSQLYFTNCSNLTILNTTWPPKLYEISYVLSRIQSIPEGLPRTLENLYIEDNALTDINYLPNSVKKMNLANNPLETLTYVQLSQNLEFLNITGCKISNITIDRNTATALNALKPWNKFYKNTYGLDLDRNIVTNPVNCKAIGGVIQLLFESQKAFKVTACVLPTIPKPTSTPNSTLAPNYTGLTVGVVLGVLVAIIVGFILGLRIQRQRAQCQSLTSDCDFDITQLRPHRLDLSDIVVGSNKPLASGAYGEVWIGTYAGRQVAIKRSQSHEPRQVQKFIDEITLLSKLESDYIVKFIGACWTRPIDIECVIEYMNLGDLRSYLAEYSPDQFTWAQKYQCIVCIVRGLIYLHTFNPPIIHRDLKSRNVLLDSTKGTKLTDFGISRIADEDITMTNNIGTYQWMAPEVISGTRYTSQADIYSFGVILSEFCTHRLPYAERRDPTLGEMMSQHDMLNAIREGRLRPSFDGVGVPVWVNEIAMQCLELNDMDRPTAITLASILHNVVTDL